MLVMRTGIKCDSCIDILMGKHVVIWNLDWNQETEHHIHKISRNAKYTN